jgi:amphi-Trp domain-containing protein
MTEFEWEKKMTRKEAASLFRAIADGLEGGGKVELEQDGWELALPVANNVELGIEIEVETQTELEIELKWATPGRQRPGGGKSG